MVDIIPIPSYLYKQSIGTSDGATNNEDRGQCEEDLVVMWWSKWLQSSLLNAVTKKPSGAKAPATRFAPSTTWTLHFDPVLWDARCLVKHCGHESAAGTTWYFDDVPTSQDNHVILFNYYNCCNTSV